MSDPALAGNGHRPPPEPDVPDGSRRSNLDHKMDIDHAQSVLIHAETGKLTNLNPRLIKEFVIRNIGKPRDLKKLRSGDISITTKDSNQNRSLMNLKNFCGIAVTTSIPEKWNSMKGTISGPSLREISDQDM